MEEGVERCEGIGKVQGYANPNDGPLRFRKPRKHDGSVFICWSSHEDGRLSDGHMLIGMLESEAHQEREWWSTRARK